MKRAALYERVSTTTQAEEGYSIDAQINKLTKFAESKDYIVVNHYTDAGYSGSKMDRPGLQNMIQHIKEKKNRHCDCIQVRSSVSFTKRYNLFDR